MFKPPTGVGIFMSNHLNASYYICEIELINYSHNFLTDTTLKGCMYIISINHFVTILSFLPLHLPPPPSPLPLTPPLFPSGLLDCLLGSLQCGDEGLRRTRGGLYLSRCFQMCHQGGLHLWAYCECKTMFVVRSTEVFIVNSWLWEGRG